VSASPVAARWRLCPYLRPYRYQLVLMLFAAILSAGTEIAIPLIAKVVIDGAITHHERGLLLPLGLLAVGLGAAGALLSLIRRWVQGYAVAGMISRSGTTSTRTCNGSTRRSTTSGSPANCSRVPPPTSPRSDGSPASGWCSRSSRS
jgi:ABC-type multidrug transport system fused ATPase/permease subunit